MVSATVIWILDARVLNFSRRMTMGAGNEVLGWVTATPNPPNACYPIIMNGLKINLPSAIMPLVE